MGCNNNLLDFKFSHLILNPGFFYWFLPADTTVKIQPHEDGISIVHTYTVVIGKECTYCNSTAVCSGTLSNTNAQFVQQR